VRRGGGNILLVANYDSDVGYAWWLMENFWALIARDAHARQRACLLAYPRIGRVPDAIRSAPIEILERRVAPSGPRGALATGRFLRARRIRAVYLTDWPALHWNYLWWRLAGVRSIVLHDHSPGDRVPTRGLKGALKALLHRLRVFSPHHFVGVAEHVRRRHIENLRVPAARCSVVENGIVPFTADRSRRAALRAEFAIPEHAVLVILVSRATTYKGLDLAIEVCQRLATARPGNLIHFLHCGDGPELEQLRLRASQPALQGSFHFAGRRTDVHALLAASDLAFHPSRGEAMSLAILEFMCAGLPVVLSNLPSVSAAVVDGETALLYAAENAAAAAAAIARLADDAELRARLGHAAAERCRQRYTLEQANAAFTRLVIPALDAGWIRGSGRG
jgi:glycosyltransferase involved in cell wall biosynthesis